MSNATSITLKTSRAALGAVARAVWCSALMALPLSGLVLFFEMTQPAKVMNAGVVPAQLASSASEVISEGSVKPWHFRGHASVALFEGVSAQRRSDYTEPAEQILSTSDAARRVLASAPFESLRPGFQAEFLSRERHRISLRIVSREPIFDRTVPDNSRLMNITEASTANLKTFSWGNWMYKAEIEDKGVEPDVVVQKVL
jgi:hypothetical protein